MSRGQVPYRDFAVEYPPAALPMFLIPAIGDGDSADYRRRFEGVMAALGVATLLLVALIAPRPWTLGFVAAAPLLLGSVFLTRFDLWPASLTVAALALFVAERFRIGAGVLAVAAAAKL
ncbi:MAG: hypothetical protein M3310_06285, partial [Actinomycetota bacterium]|nr:hypothetical protein [Actinomycetota bacterium]